MIELKGKLVVLRALEREDCRTLWGSFEHADPPTEDVRPGLSIEGADAWFDEIQAKQEKEQIYLGIFSADGVVIGDIQLANVDWRHRTATVGFGIARAEHRGQGFGSDALRTLVAYGFEHLDLFRIEATTLEHNAPARRILKKCGFIEEGVERQAVYLAGKRRDRIKFSLLRTD